MTRYLTGVSTAMLLFALDQRKGEKVAPGAGPWRQPSPNLGWRRKFYGGEHDPGIAGFAVILVPQMAGAVEVRVFGLYEGVVNAGVFTKLEQAKAQADRVLRLYGYELFDEEGA